MLASFETEGFAILFRRSGYDEFILTEVFVQDCYKAFKKYISPKTIIDIGAHIGSFTLRAYRDFPEARIWSWEILSENFDLLQLNTAQNRATDRVKIFELGAGGVAGLRFISKHSMNTGAAMLNDLYQAEELKDMRIFSAATLDFESILNITGEKEIDLVKIDAERGELEILEQGNPDVIKRVKVYIMEVHDKLAPQYVKDRTFRMYEHLKQVGFTEKKVEPYDNIKLFVRNDIDIIRCEESKGTSTQEGESVHS